MKLKSKIIILNVIILSLAFGISSYLILKNSYDQTLGNEINSCLEQNKMINSMYQIKVLQLISGDNYDGAESLKNVTIADTLTMDKSEQAVVNNKGEVITGDIDAKAQINTLISKHKDGEQAYLIYSEEDNITSIVSISGMSVGKSQFYIVNKYEISKTLENLKNQQKDLRKILFVTLMVSCIGIYIVTTLMTKPINKLLGGINEITKGNFKVRTSIETKDEIGKLSESFDTMAEEVQYYIEKIQHENEAKESFMANFTHELKTPLTTVIGYADLLRRSDVDDSLRMESAGYIFTEGTRLQKMSMKLLDFFMLGREKMTLSPMYLSALLEEAAESVKESYIKNEIEIKLDVKDLYAIGDYELVKTGLINILDNSRKASSKGDVVEVTADKINDKIVIQITDHGFGIPEDELSRITEAFYMVNKSRTRQEGGAGLGLSLVSAIIDAVGGSMKIESTCGKGTKVSIVLKEAEHED